MASVILTVPAAGAQFGVPIPNNTALCGVNIDVQSVLFDAGASHGLAFSAGLEYRIGT